MAVLSKFILSSALLVAIVAGRPTPNTVTLDARQLNDPGFDAGIDGGFDTGLGSDLDGGDTGLNAGFGGAGTGLGTGLDGGDLGFPDGFNTGAGDINPGASFDSGVAAIDAGLDASELGGVADFPAFKRLRTRQIEDTQNLDGGEDLPGFYDASNPLAGQAPEETPAVGSSTRLEGFEDPKFAEDAGTGEEGVNAGHDLGGEAELEIDASGSLLKRLHRRQFEQDLGGFQGLDPGTENGFGSSADTGGAIGGAPDEALPPTDGSDTGLDTSAGFYGGAGLDSGAGFDAGTDFDPGADFGSDDVGLDASGGPDLGDGASESIDAGAPANGFGEAPF